MAGVTGANTILSTIQSLTEVVPQQKDGWTYTYSFYKFKFVNRDECTVSINGADPIYLYKGEGFETESGDVRIESFIIQEENIRYHWRGFY